MKTGVVFAFIGVAFLAFIMVEIYDKIDKDSPSPRIKCHENNTVFEKLIEPKLLKKLKNTLEKGEAKITLLSKASSYEKSTLFKYVGLNDIKKMTKDTFHIKTESKDIELDFYIYENDPKDPNKKSSSCKFSRGYIVASFLYEENLIYKIQLDFFDREGRDIEEKLQCIYNSIITLQ